MQTVSLSKNPRFAKYQTLGWMKNYAPNFIRADDIDNIFKILIDHLKKSNK